MCVCMYIYIYIHLYIYIYIQLGRQREGETERERERERERGAWEGLLVSVVDQMVLHVLSKPSRELPSECNARSMGLAANEEHNYG